MVYRSLALVILLILLCMPTFLEVSISPTPVSQEEADHTALILPSRLSPNGPYNVDGAKSRMDRAILDDGRSRSSEKSIYWRNMEDIRWTELWPFKSQFPWLDPYNHTYPEYMLIDELRLGKRNISSLQREPPEPKPLSPSPNDWIVTGEDVHEDEVIILTGNLIIQAGGNLTLINCTLLMNCTYDGEWQILVKSSGILNVLRGSNITAYNPEYEFLFYVYGRLVMQDSFLSRCGYDYDHPGLWLETNEGVTIGNCVIARCNTALHSQYSSNITIYNCEITQNDGYGISCWYSYHVTITNCIISQNDWEGIDVFLCNNVMVFNCIITDGIDISDSGRIFISGCQINNGTTFIYGECSNVIISNCTINNGGIRLKCSSAYITISKCTINNSTYGIEIEECVSTHITVSECMISDYVWGISIYWYYKAPNNTYISISNCVINKGGDGINYYRGYNARCQISNCVISDNHYGIMLDGASNIHISHCAMKNNRAIGLLCEGSSNITISGCTISNCTGASRWRTYAGVYIRASVNVTVKNNIFYRNGIILEGKEISHFISHIIENNTVNGKPLCYVINTTDYIIPSNVGQVIVVCSENIVIHSANLSYVDAGIEIFFSNNILIGNTIVNNNTMFGLLCEKSANITISGCYVSSNGRFGIRCKQSFNLTICNCTIDYNGMEGIYCDSSSVIIILDCSIRGHKYEYYYTPGIECINTSNITISGCIISQNAYGIAVSESSSVNIYNCVVSDNIWLGIGIVCSTAVTLQSNIFVHDGVSLFGNEPRHFFSHTMINNTVNGKPLYYIVNTTDYIVPSDAGQIIIVNSESVTINQANLSYTDIGIQIINSKELMLLDCSVVNDIGGIFIMGDVSYVVIRECLISDCMVGIMGSISGCIADCMIIDCYMTHNYMACSLWGINISIYSCKLLNNAPVDWYVCCVGGRDISIYNCIVENNSAIAALSLFGSNITILDCIINNNNGSGLLIYNSSEVTIRNCTICDNHIFIYDYHIIAFGEGLIIEGGSNIIVSNCTINHNHRFGIYCFNSSIVIRYCNIFGNGAHGLYVRGIHVVNATYNWWNSTAGPEYKEEGDPYDPEEVYSENGPEYLLYKPWLTEPYAPPTISMSLSLIEPVPMNRFFQLKLSLKSYYNEVATFIIELCETEGFQVGDKYGDGGENKTVIIGFEETATVEFKAMVFGELRPKQIITFRIYKEGELLLVKEYSISLVLEDIDITAVITPLTVKIGTDQFSILTLVAYSFIYKTKILVMLRNLETGDVKMYSTYVENETACKSYIFIVTDDFVDTSKEGLIRLELSISAIFPEIDPNRIAIGPTRRFLYISVSSSASSWSVLITDLFFDIIAYDGNTYRAYRIINITRLKEIEPNKLIDPEYKYSIFNWLVVDSDGNIVMNDEMYCEVAFTAEIASLRWSALSHENIEKMLELWYQLLAISMMLETIEKIGRTAANLLKQFLIYKVIPLKALEGKIPFIDPKDVNQLVDLLTKLRLFDCYADAVSKAVGSPEEVFVKVAQAMLSLAISLLIEADNLLKDVHVEPHTTVRNDTLREFYSLYLNAHVLAYAAIDFLAGRYSKWWDYWVEIAKELTPGMEVYEIIKAVKKILTKEPAYFDLFIRALDKFRHAKLEEAILKDKSLEFRNWFIKNTRNCIIVNCKEREGQHRLYLHVYDAEGNHVGFTNGYLEVGINGTYYIEYTHGIMIILHAGLSEFQIVIDATYAEQEIEEYTLIVSLTKNGTAVSEDVSSGTIRKGSSAAFTVKIEEEQVKLLKEKQEEKPQLPFGRVSILQNILQLISEKLNEILGVLPVINDIIAFLDTLAPGYGALIFTTLLVAIVITIAILWRKRRREELPRWMIEMIQRL